MGNARPFVLHDMLLFDPLAFPNLDFQFGGALLDFAAQLGDPKHGDREDTGERAQLTSNFSSVHQGGGPARQCPTAS